MVSIRKLTHAFGDNVVLRNIDLEVATGEILAVMGSSGGGKTTLLRCIAGLIVPTEGKVSINGISVSAEPEAARSRMGMVFQSAALFDFMNVQDNVLFGPKRSKKELPKPVDELAHEALERVGLGSAKDLMPAELSGGMKKRVGIARAIALQPEIILYDEPTTGLDPITTYTIDALIMELRESMGVTSILVSHDVSSVRRTANRIAFLDGGSVSFLGTPAEFLESTDPSIRELVDKAFADEISAK